MQVSQDSKQGAQMFIFSPIFLKYLIGQLFKQLVLYRNNYVAHDKH